MRCLAACCEAVHHAYQTLQRSQESLLRAEKMAALGRLTAGIAHEMNTPLGASLTSLNLLQHLIAERRTAVERLDATTQRQQDIDAEMDMLLRKTQQWMDKAASYIRSLKLHARELQRSEERHFSVLQAIEDTGLLLSHRLRFSRCFLSVSCTASDPMLYGDPSKLGQIMTNLIINAIDAYSTVDRDGGKIRIEVKEDGSFLEVRVSDHGCGISPELTERIFDEFFSTKPLGEGTGLGLSISRYILANFFDGTIRVESALGQGSTFILRLIRDRKNRVTPRPLTEQTPTVATE